MNESMQAPGTVQQCNSRNQQPCVRTSASSAASWSICSSEISCGMLQSANWGSGLSSQYLHGASYRHTSQVSCEEVWRGLQEPSHLPLTKAPHHPQCWHTGVLCGATSGTAHTAPSWWCVDHQQLAAACCGQRLRTAWIMPQHLTAEQLATLMYSWATSDAIQLV